MQSNTFCSTGGAIVCNIHVDGWYILSAGLQTSRTWQSREHTPMVVFQSFNGSGWIFWIYEQAGAWRRKA